MRIIEKLADPRRHEGHPEGILVGAAGILASCADGRTFAVNAPRTHLLGVNTAGKSLLR